MGRNNIGRTSLKMKLLGMLDRKLTVSYVNDYLRVTGEFKGYKISYEGLSMDDM